MDEIAYRQIPKMNKLLELSTVQKAAEGLPRPLVKNALQAELDDLRQELKNGTPLPTENALQERLANAIQKAGQWQLRKVFNATGVVMHTNLGRAPLGQALSAHISQAAVGYSTLEYDLESGSRGSRYALVEQQLCRLTGAEAAMVVNNNAAAVFLMLNTLAKGKHVVVSRGELVEIGGAFRVPEIMNASGASLLEIGTTNKTHLADYEKALEQENIGALLKVHTSNFKIVGFSEEVALAPLSALAEKHHIPLLYDLGAGFLVHPELLGLHDGVYVPDAVKQADLCCFSGDKLFGAGQAGVILGKKEYIDRMKRNQLARMLRVDKMTLASVEAALRLYEDPETAKMQLPVLRMLSVPASRLQEIAERLTTRCRALCPSFSFTTVPCTDEPGGGSLPTLELPGWAVAVSCSAMKAEKIEAALRALSIPIIGRIYKDRVLFSVRTLLFEDEELFLNVLAELEVVR